MQAWMCTNCGWHYDPAEGVAEEHVAAGTAWENLPEGFRCPLCGAVKDTFELTEL